MRLLISLLAVLLLIVENAYAHAMPQYPVPFCSWPSRNRPCGCSNQGSLTTPQAVWTAGKLNWLTWFAINGDGLGQVFMKINTDGVLNFETGNYTQIKVNQVSPPDGPFVNTFNYNNFSLPNNIRCTGKTGLCTVQMWTNSGRGWYGCTVVNITAPSTYVAPNTNVVCYDYPGGVCGSIKYNKHVAVAYIHRKDMSSWWETQARRYWGELNQAWLFANISTPACKDAMLNYFCDLVFPPCQGLSGQAPTIAPNLFSECHAAMAACAPTPAGLKALPCDATFAASIYPADLAPTGRPVIPTTSLGQGSATTGPTAKPSTASRAQATVLSVCVAFLLFLYI